MGFFKRLFSKKIISKVSIVNHIDGLNEDDKLDNIVVGDMMEGFDGMVMAEIYNDEHSSKTTFEVTYTDGTSEYIVTEDGDSDYNFYIKYVED